MSGELVNDVFVNKKGERHNHKDTKALRKISHRGLRGLREGRRKSNGGTAGTRIWEEEEKEKAFLSTD
jgi:hypothetical protein